MAVFKSANFEAEWAAAAESIAAQPPSAADEAARLNQWRREEWHGWFRWRVCRSGTDWSKPVWILLLSAGFGGLIWYGSASGKWFVTAGGIVAWFTLINLAFFTYFGLILPGPPRTVPGPFQPDQKVRAVIGLYSPGYERRRLARVWVRIAAPSGSPWICELPFATLPNDLHELLQRQTHWRIQRADAPATQAVVETLSVWRDQINAGAHPIKIIAWCWDEQSLKPFGRDGKNGGA